MAINDRWHQQVFKNFKGLNLDISPEKLPPEFAELAVNMQVSDSGVPETVNGCKIAKDIADNIYRIGYFPTRGEDYVFIYYYNHTDSTYDIAIYKFPDFTEITYQTDDINDLEFNEPVWFARHMGEMWLGNRADGMWRWGIGHQSLMRGSAPLGIIVEVAEEGDTEKLYTEWWFTYDYEYRGGRSPLSRKARARLYSNKHTVKVTIDTPPDISKNRRIYASPDDGTTWYYVKEITERNETEVTLDDELVDRIADAYKYSEDEANAISPRAKMGISAFDMLWVGNLVESPTIVQHSEIGTAYFNDTDFFDLGEPITNLIRYGKYVIASTPDSIYGLIAEGDIQVLLSIKTGAYEGSMAVVNGVLWGVGDRGVWKYDGKGFKIGGGFEGLSGINLAGFPDLQKSERYHLWTSQQDYEQGTYTGGISSDFIPGSLSLQPNLLSVLGLEGVLDRQNMGSSVGAVYYINTGHSTIDYCAQPFKIIGSASDEVTFGSIVLQMKEEGSPTGEFVGEIRLDDGGDPDMTSDTLATFAGELKPGDYYDRTFELSESITLNEDTQYWVVIPKQGYGGAEWKVRCYDPSWGSGKLLYPQGEYLQKSEDGGVSWANVSGSVFFQFALKGYGSIIVTPAYLSDYNVDKKAHSDVYAYAQRFSTDRDVSTVRGEILIYNKTLSPGYPGIEIQGDSSNAPDGVAVSTASNHSVVSDIMRFDFDGGTLSQDTIYWLVVKKVGDATNYWDWGESDCPHTGWLQYKTNGSWTVSSQGLWCKIFADIGGDANVFAASGTWESNEIIIGANDDFHKIYATYMKPSATDCNVQIYKNEYYSAAYQGWVDISALLPNSITDATTKVKLKTVLTLGDSQYTPTVDSLLVTYEKENDGGAKLWASNVKGAYWLSTEDWNSDSIEELTYVLSKYGFWHKQDQPFFGYLPIGDDVCIGIGKNSNETYQNIYYLDDDSVDDWYNGDTATIPIYTEWKTGYLLYSHIIKQFRKLWISMTGDKDVYFTVEATVAGAERYSDDDASYTQTMIFRLKKDTIKSEYMSFSPWMQGKYVQLKFYASGVDWKLHDFELGWRDTMRRHIAIPSEETEYDFLFYINQDDFDKIEVLDISDPTNPVSADTHINPDRTGFDEDWKGLDAQHGYLTAVDRGGYLWVFSIGSDGILTETGHIDLDWTGQNIRMPCVQDITGHYVFVVGLEGATDNNALYVVDISDKTDPVLVNTSSLGPKDTKHMTIMKNLLIIEDAQADYIRVFNIQNPANPTQLYTIDTTIASWRLATSSNSNLLGYVDAESDGSIHVKTCTIDGYSTLAKKDIGSGENNNKVRWVSWDENTERLYVELISGGKIYVREYDKNLNQLNSIELFAYASGVAHLIMKNGYIYAFARTGAASGHLYVIDWNLDVVYNESDTKFAVDYDLCIHGKHS